MPKPAKSCPFPACAGRATHPLYGTCIVHTFQLDAYFDAPMLAASWARLREKRPSARPPSAASLERERIESALAEGRCIMEGCTRDAHAMGKCRPHYDEAIYARRCARAVARFKKPLA